jgi:hypothetical protein
MALLPGSPAIDLVPTRSCTDPNGAALHTDQRGVQRPIGGGCDAGAYEAAGPDELIRLLHGTIVGEDVFNSTGNGQTRKATVAPGGSVTFKVLLQNDGVGPDSFTLKGDGNRAGVGTVRYLAGGTTDITSAVEAGTYVTPTLTPGQQIAIDMVITGDPSVTVAITGKWLLTARSVATPTLLDAVAAKVRVAP